MRNKLIILFCLFNSFVNATNYYVAKTGGDGNVGSFASPWLTIQHGVDALYAGDTLFIRVGSYTERVVVYGRDGTYSQPIVIMNYAAEVPVINGGTTLPSGDNSELLRIWENHIKIRGLTVKNSNKLGTKVGGSGILSTGLATTISYCTVDTCWDNGIHVGGDSSVIEYCTVYDVCLNNTNGVLVAGGGNNGSGVSARQSLGDTASACILRHNTIHDVWGEALSTFRSGNITIEDNIVYDVWAIYLYVQNAFNCVIQRNLVYRTKDMPNGSQVGIYLGDEGGAPLTHDNTVVNNIAYGCRRNFYSGYLYNTLVAHNTFVNSVYTACVQIADVTHTLSYFQDNIIIQEGALAPIYSIGSHPGLTFSYNLWGETPDADVIGTGDVVSNPHFTDSLNHDYTLKSTSPAINAGIGAGVNLDYLEHERGTVPDIGAYEYSGAPPAGALAVVTSNVSNITLTTATSGGNVTDDGGVEVTARGVCWSTSANPTTSDTKTTDGSGEGAFTSSITGLTANTAYHVRAYATNASGTTYGADIGFTTSLKSACNHNGKKVKYNGKVVIK